MFAVPGTRICCLLLVGTLNFTTCASAEAAVVYAGLVPLARESGSSVTPST